mgnify:CR=1 FL=1
MPRPIRQRFRCFSFDGDVLTQLLGPVTYVLWQQRTCLYVGYSANGLVRIFDSNHAQRKFLSTITRLDIYVCQSKMDAEVLEVVLIRQLHPRHNKTNYHNTDFRVLSQAGICGKTLSESNEKAIAVCQKPAISGTGRCAKHQLTFNAIKLRKQTTNEILDELAQMP